MELCRRLRIPQMPNINTKAITPASAICLPSLTLFSSPPLITQALVTPHTITIKVIAKTSGTISAMSPVNIPTSSAKFDGGII